MADYTPQLCPYRGNLVMPRVSKFCVLLPLCLCLPSRPVPSQPLPPPPLTSNSLNCSGLSEEPQEAYREVKALLMSRETTPIWTPATKDGVDT